MWNSLNYLIKVYWRQILHLGLKSCCSWWLNFCLSSLLIFKTQQLENVKLTNQVIRFWLYLFCSLYASSHCNFAYMITLTSNIKKIGSDFKILNFNFVNFMKKYNSIGNLWSMVRRKSILSCYWSQLANHTLHSDWLHIFQ